MRRFTTAACIIIFLATGSARASDGKDFMMSCSYGVMAGTLVGIASLAFTNQPGKNLNRVARGASLGLYAGILLGLYVVYGLPAEDPEKDMVKVMVTPTFNAASEVDGLEGSVRVLTF